MKIFVIILLLILSQIPLNAQEEIEHTNILFVLDASFSMRKSWETKSKWTIAKETLIDVADSLKARLKDNVSFGIRAYGHQSMPVKNDCLDSELILPIGNNDIETIKNTLMAISPKGITPLAYSLEETKADFTNTKGKNILILITDGAESCEGDPCYIMKILMNNNVILKPFIIGLNIPIESLQAYECIGGEVYNQVSQKDFKKNLQKSIDRALTFTTLQVNLLDSKGNAKQTNKAMFFYTKKENKLKYTFYHKLNNGIADTLYLEPSKYKIEVQTIPKVTSEYFSLNAAKHNIVNIIAPTGILRIKTIDENNKETLPANKSAKYLIKKQDETHYLHQEYITSKQEYLIGKYSIDILTLPIIQKDIIIKDYEVTEITIPASGSLNISTKMPIYGAIFIKTESGLKNIYSLKPKTTQAHIVLNHGKYELVFRYSKDKKMIKTKTYKFVIEANKNTKISL